MQPHNGHDGSLCRTMSHEDIEQEIHVIVIRVVQERDEQGILRIFHSSLYSESFNGIPQSEHFVVANGYLLPHMVHSICDIG
jgi:hypothetical protein